MDFMGNIEDIRKISINKLFYINHNFIMGISVLLAKGIRKL